MDNPTSSEPVLVSRADAHFEAARLQLARLNLAGAQPLREVLKSAAELVSSALRVSRVSIWFHMQGWRSYRCDVLFQTAQKLLSEGAIIHEKDFPEYFRALQKRTTVSVVDVDGEPYAAEFRESYFRPLGISSMLDAPIYLAGKVAGIICHEHVGPVRRWDPAECGFASYAAEVVARLYEEGARRQAESTLGVFQGQVSTLERMSSLGQLAAGIAHDFRNLLGAASGYSEMIENAGSANPALVAMVGKLNKVLDQGVRLTHELTAFGIAEPAKPRVTDLRSLLAKYRGMLTMAAGPGIAVDIDGESQVGRVFIDATQLERILLNLVLNAKDAMPGGGTVTVSLREAWRTKGASRDSLYTVVEIGDTGQGMDEATREKMFEPYFTTKGDKGTGLGLAIVNQIVTQIGGYIEVDSELGKGTRISVFLPKIGQPQQD